MLRKIRFSEFLCVQFRFLEFLLTRIENSDDLGQAKLEDEKDTANLTITDLEAVEEEDEESYSTSSGGKETENQPSMAERQKFVSLCASTLSKSYSGDPLSLQSFICGIELLETLADDNVDLLTAFIKTRLDGKALECIPTEGATIANIKSSLRASIKPESSKVVEGKILALRFNPTKPTDFTDEATALAEAFQRSLIIEGIPQQKAKSMAVEKAIEICRKNAKSDTVKAILASKEFSDPAEVVAKLVIESNNVHQERQVLSFQQTRYNRGKNFRFRGNNRNQGHGSYYANNRGQNYRGQSNRGQYRGGNRGYYQNGINRGHSNRVPIAYHNAPVVKMPLDN